MNLHDMRETFEVSLVHTKNIIWMQEYVIDFELMNWLKDGWEICFRVCKLWDHLGK